MKEYKYKINGMKFTVSVGDIVDNEAQVEVNGVSYKVELDRKPKASQKPALSQSGHTNHGNVAAAPVASKPVAKPAVSAGAAEAVKSPLPGTVMSIDVNVGDTVNAGDKVGVLEAMKMENDIRTTRGGKVTKILVSVGDAILEGTDIMIIE
ncbi:MAG: acetyl-CoA carboxylase biotin carboxyl carrier protein subunit [Muribaculaceae bacterium]|nr:acetyl-CoA carboxylase biotin carboxyl carrier protein subunit [Muribaculaceae bacterium]